MFNALTISIAYLFVLIIMFVAAYGIGYFIFKILIPNYKLNGFYGHVFFKTLVGASFIIILVSLICTIGKTINFVFVIVALFAAFEVFLLKKNHQLPVQLKSDKDKTPIFNLKNILGGLFLILIVFLWHVTIVLKFGTFAIDIIEKDSFFYAEISKCLISTGRENTFTTSNLINEKYHFPTPYHYYDLWFNGFVCKIFNLNHSLSLYLVTYSFFTSIFLFGLLSVMERYITIKPWHIVIAAFLLFVSGLYISENILHLFQYNGQMEGIMERYGGKLTPVYCFTLGLIILFVLNKNIKAALIAILILPIVFISLAPAIFCGLLLFCLYKLFTKNDLKTFYLRLMFYCLITMMSIGLFYFLFKKNDLNYRLDKPLMYYTDLYNFSFFRIKFYLTELFLKCYAHPFIFILNYLPFAFIIFYLLIRKKINQYFKSLLILFSLIWFCGLIAANTLYLMDDAYQLYTNALVLWHVLFAVSIVIFLYKEKDKSITKHLMTFIFILALLFNGWHSWCSYENRDSYDPKPSEKYLIQINLACQKFDQEVKGATFYNESFYKNLFISYPLEYYCVPFILSPKVYIPFNLTSVNEVPKINKYQIEKNLKKSPFNLYLKEHEVNSDCKNILQQQINFIKINNIKYLICPKEQATNFQDYFSVTIQITDSLTGQRFIVLD